MPAQLCALSGREQRGVGVKGEGQWVVAAGFGFAV